MLVFHWRLSDSKFPLICRTILSILVDLHNAVVWLVSICSPISKSFSLFSEPLRTVLSTPNTIGITVTLMFHSFLVFGWDPNTCLSFCFLFTFSAIWQVLFFCQLYSSLDKVNILHHEILENSGLFIYHVVACSNFNFLHNFQWITFPTQSGLLLISLCVSLLHSIIVFHSFQWFSHQRLLISGTWLTPSLPNSPGLFLVYWSIK